MNSLQKTDAEGAVHYVAPRVTLLDIETSIKERYDINAHKACAMSGQVECVPSEDLKVLSLCVLVTANGFTVVGKSAPASPANYNADYGKQLAYEDAVRQLWPLMGYALKDRLYRDSDKHPGLAAAS